MNKKKIFKIKHDFSKKKEIVIVKEIQLSMEKKTFSYTLDFVKCSPLRLSLNN